MSGRLRICSIRRATRSRPLLRVGVHLAEAADPAAELRLLLDEEHRQADLRQAERRAQPGDAAADHERARGRLHDDRVERRREPRAGDAGTHEPHGLARRAGLVVGVRPRALLPDVHLRVLVRVQARPLGDAAEGERVQLRRAGGDDEAVELLFLDVAHDLLLRRVRAGEHRAPGDDDTGLVLDGGDDAVDVDVVGDVSAAAADVDAEPPIAHAGTFVRSRCAAACAAAAPACRIDSGMSLAPEAAPATYTPAMLVRAGSTSSSGSST